MNKKGVGHIEIILSFIIFLVAVIFILVLFNPINNNDLAPSAMDIVANQLIYSTSTNALIYSVNVKSAAVNEAVGLINYPGGYKASVFSSSGARVGARYDSSTGKILFEPGSGGLFYIILSPDVAENGLSSGVVSEDYEFASSSNKTVVSEFKLEALNQSYASDYSSLKKRLLVPEGINFAFRVYSDGNTVASANGNIPSKVEVYVNSRRIDLIRKTGEIVPATLEVKIW